MSHKRKDTYVADGEWRQHLRPESKRDYHKAERRHFKEHVSEMVRDEGIRGPGTSKKKMKTKKKIWPESVLERL